MAEPETLPASSGERRSTLLIGWDGAGWNQIHPLLDSGGMPNLARIVNSGVMGHLATLTPLCPPLLWTSVSTGHYADRHNILDLAEPDPRTGGLRPVTRASLAAPHIWEILAHEGLRCQSIGWPVTHPAGPPATCVSDGFPHSIPQSLHPPSLESTLGPFRFNPQEWTGDDLRLFVPELALIDQDQDKRLARLAVILAESVSVHAAATTLLETAACDFTAVWFGAVGRACALFPPDTAEIYREVVPGVYRFLDLLLGRLLALAGPGALVMLVSDRAAAEPDWRASTGSGPRGMLCATGPAIQPDELTFGASLLDIAPTILALYGFAPAPGMPGRAISEICAVPPSRAVRLQPAPPPAPLQADLQELADLGYTDTVAAENREASDAARRRRDFHLARVLLSQRRAAEAIPLLERLVREDSGTSELHLYLGHAYFQSARYPECRVVCETVLAEFPDSPFAPLARAHLAIAEGHYSEALSHLAACRDDYGIAAALDAAMGEAWLRLENWDLAIAAFRSATLTDPAMATAHEGLARALFAVDQFDQAAEAALDAIRLHYALPDSHRILAASLQRLGRAEAAAGALATSEMLRARMSAV